MSLPANSFVEQSVGPIPALSFINVDDCILHPRRRRLRHLTGVSLRNLVPNFSVLNRRPSISSSNNKNKDMMITGLNTPLDRQLHLQSINNHSFLNTFISFHFANEKDYDKVFHVTEVVNSSINPNFQEFNIRSLIHSKDCEFLLKIWTSSKASPDDWSLFKLYKINLSHLLYLNKNLDEVKIDTKNSVLITLEDGVYLLPIDSSGFSIDDYKLVTSDASASYSHKFNVNSLSFDLIMKLNNLDTVLEDMKKSKKILSEQINNEYKDTVVVNEHRQNQLKSLISKQQEINFMKKAKVEELKKIKLRKLNLIKSKRLKQDSLNEINLNKLKESYSSILVENEANSQELLLERAKIVKQVLEIFPKQDIQTWLNIPDFDILPTDLNLSNLNNLINASDTKTIEQLNAGFGYVSHISYLLSRYLAIPLKYQIQSFGSTSYIIDKISQINQRKIFPLFYTNQFYRFQYAVILLNRNIQDILRNSYHY